MAIVNTFSGTGTSEVISGRSISVRMSFVGTASVDIEVPLPDGTWIKTATAITSSYDNVYESPVRTSLRLNCTAYTNPVKYALEAND